MNKRILHIAFFLFLPFCLLAQQEVRFEATTNAKQVVLGGYFQLTFTLHNGEGSGIRPPSLKDFNILSGPNKSVSTSSINGVWSSKYSFIYTLQPKKVGRFRIGEATMVSNGVTYKSNPLTIEVVKGKDPNATTQNDIKANLEDQVYVKAEISVVDAFPGQQIILDYKIYMTRGVENFNLLSESEYGGFYAEDVRHFDGRIIQEVIDGQQYSTKILKRMALFPQQTGLLTIEPMTLQLAILDENQPQRRSIFFTPKVTRITVQTNEVKINVKPVPSGSPTTYAGAVGSFNAFASINKRVMSTDDAISLKMTVKGDGDIKRVLPPPLILSDTFEIYEPRVIDEKTYENRGRIQGSKVFEYLILPKVPGSYSISPQFSYFYPDSSTYMIIQLDTFPLDVRKGTKGRIQSEDEVEFSGPVEDIRFIKTTTKLGAPQRPGFFQSIWYWLLMLLPFVALGTTIFYKRWQERQLNVDKTLLKMNRAQKVAVKKLEQAKTYMEQGNSKSFYEEVSLASFGYVCDKLNIPLSELTKANVKERLQSLRVNDQYIDRFMQIIQTCEMALFAGKDNAAAMQETYQSAIEVIANIEQEITK